MARYVDASQAAEIVSEDLKIDISELVDVFADIPTAVVCCKDCEHYDKGGCKHFGYHTYTPDVDEDDFCSYGKEKR